MNAPLSPTPPSVVAQIANLPALPMPEIRALWQRLFGTDVPTHNRQLLERGLAYRLQENAFRAVDPGLLERNRRTASRPWSRPAKTSAATVTTARSPVRC